MKSSLPVYISLLIVTVFWGGSFSAIKHLLEIFSPVELLVVRFLPAMFIFLVISLLFFFKDTKTIIKNDFKRILFIGLIGTPAYHLALNYGETHISAGLASLIIGLNPSLTFLLSTIVLKEGFRFFKVLGLMVSFFGLFVLVKYGSGEALTYGYLLAVFITVLAPSCWALYTVGSKKLANKYSPLAVASLATIIGTFPCLTLINPTLTAKFLHMGYPHLFSLLFLSIFATVVGSIAWMYGVRKISATRVSSFVYLVPFFAVIIGVVMLGESLNLFKILGGILIMGGVYITNRKY